MRFVLEDSVPCYDKLISKAKVDAFRVSAVKKMATEVFKIFNNISPGYFENYFLRARIPYNLHDYNKLVQPMILTTSHGIKSFQYYGAHLWNSFPADIKSAISISQFKGLIRKWSGPECNATQLEAISDTPLTVFIKSIIFGLWSSLCVNINSQNLKIFLTDQLWKVFLSHSSRPLSAG